MAEPLVTVRGLQEVVAALQTLEAQVKAQITADAINAGAQIVALEMSQRAPRASGRLSKNVATEYSIASGVATARIGPARDVFYGGILNQGAAPHTIKPFRYARGRRRGQGRSGGTVKKVLASPERVFGTKVRHPGVTSRPFIQTALAVAGARAVTAMGRTLWTGIERAASKVRA